MSNQKHQFYNNIKPEFLRVKLSDNRTTFEFNLQGNYNDNKINYEK